MASSGKYPLFVITFHRDKVKGTIRVRATDKRRAKNLARRRLGKDIKILCAFRWDEHMKRIKNKRPAVGGPSVENQPAFALTGEA